MAGVVLWTIALGAALGAVNRWFFGAKNEAQWATTRDLNAIPRAAGPVMLPKYLPDRLSWPPKRILYRTGTERGIWFGLEDFKRSRIAVWYGYQTGEPPSQLGVVSECVRTRGMRCPNDWSLTTRRLNEGDDSHLGTTAKLGVHEDIDLILVSRFRARENRRILESLARDVRGER